MNCFESSHSSFLQVDGVQCHHGAYVKIVQFQRNPFIDQFSIESLFASIRQEMKKEGVDVDAQTVPNQSKGFWPRLANIIWAARNQGDVNHITGDIHYLAIGLKKARTILTIHDCYPLDRFSGIRRWILLAFWYELPAHSSAVVTVISQESKRQLLRHVRVPAERITVVPDAVAPIFQPYPKKFNRGCPQILQIGTKPNKNVPRLIEALQGLNCHLKIIGVLDRELLRMLDNSGISYDADENLGEAAMYRAYCDADIVAFASTYEGFGMPIIEAQWVERPVVTSNCSSMPEVAGGAACLVDPYDVSSIRRGIERVVEDEMYRTSLIEQGRTNRERFSLEAVAKQYLALYEQLAGLCLNHKEHDERKEQWLTSRGE